jgi:predicted glycogen debranching enzyme
MAEWILTNGRGGYASGTIGGINTRKYHGLLITGFDDFGRREVVVQGLEEMVIVDGIKYYLSAHHYQPDVIHPTGFELVRQWSIEPDKVIIDYEVDGCLIQKSIRMLAGADATLVEYRVEGGAEVEFFLRPLLAWRNIHEIRHKEQWLQADVIQHAWKDGIQLEQRGQTSDFFGVCLGARYNQQPLWYERMVYQAEQARGYEASEDVWSPGEFIVKGASVRLYLASAKTREEAQSIVKQEEKQQREGIVITKSLNEMYVFEGDGGEILTRWYHRLLAQRNDFLVEWRQGTYMVAGYPWFGVWGRDSLIALKGYLTPLYSSPETIRDVLTQLAGCMVDGLISNVIDTGQQDTFPQGYNSVDTSLWWIIRVYEYWQASHDDTFVRDMWPRLQEIVNRYITGTAYGIRMDSDGLIATSDALVALTWMDAIVDGRPVSPRAGKAVEIQALWFNALSSVQELMRNLELTFESVVCTGGHEEPLNKVTWDLVEAEQPSKVTVLEIRELGIRSDHELELILSQVRKSFRKLFTDKDRGYLADVVHTDGSKDWSMRPNQLWAIGLPFPLTTKTYAARAIELVEQRLLTTIGLRTLAQDEAGYIGAYGGDQTTRDRAYHQGAIWPWLVGVWARARLALDPSPGSVDVVRRLIASLFTKLEERDLAYIPELFADSTLVPEGTIHQAWNVGEIVSIMEMIKELAQ